MGHQCTRRCLDDDRPGQNEGDTTMTEYTPTTYDVRRAGYLTAPVVSPEAFDRWLAAHDAEVAANALRRFASGRYDAFLEQPELKYLEQPSELSRRYAKAALDLRNEADRIEREATNHKPNPELGNSAKEADR